MKYIKGIIATTHIDSHNECFSKDALESLVEQNNKNFIPLIVEHDPRKAPIGRVISSQLVKLDAEEYGVEATFEIFENEDDSKLLMDNRREIKIGEHNLNSLIISYDRSYQNPEGQKLIAELNDIINSKVEPQFFTKKAAEPLSLLTIGGAFILGSAASGFFNQIGADSWELFKEKLKTIFKMQKNEENEKLLSFDFIIEKEGYLIEVQIILTNPEDEGIESFLEIELKNIDKILTQYFRPEYGLKKIVMEYSNNSTKVKFGLRKDDVPVFLEN